MHAEVCRTVEKVAPTDVTVLLLGESGTGKELFARALHDLSAPPARPFVAINCAAIPDNLLESELFGYEKGAFTGAVRQIKGKLELAQTAARCSWTRSATCRCAAGQAAALPPGAGDRAGRRAAAIPVDVRIVCATNQDLEAIRTGGFREDLYYRIGEMALNIPPLRDRNDDCVVLARHLIDKFSADHGRRRLQLAPDALAALRSHPWAGNVRELENRIKRAVILTEGQSITSAHMGLAAPRFGGTGSCGDASGGARRGGAEGFVQCAGAVRRQPFRGCEDPGGQPPDRLQPAQAAQRQPAVMNDAGPPSPWRNIPMNQHRPATSRVRHLLAASLAGRPASRRLSNTQQSERFYNEGVQQLRGQRQRRGHPVAERHPAGPRQPEGAPVAGAALPADGRRGFRREGVAAGVRGAARRRGRVAAGAGADDAAALRATFLRPVAAGCYA